MARALLIALLGVTGFTFDAEAAVQRGMFNYRGLTYYSNGYDAYCQAPYNDPRVRELDRWEERELRRMRFDGYCPRDRDGGYPGRDRDDRRPGRGRDRYPRHDAGVLEGAWSYNGRTYFINGVDAYCEGSGRAPQMTHDQYLRMTQLRYDGQCR